MSKFLSALAGALALSVSALAQGMLLVPDSTADVVHGFDPYDGIYVGVVIPFYSGFSTPINAIDSTRGTIYVSDQVADAIYEFDYSGNYIRTITNLASSGVDNIRGIAIRDGYLYVTNGSGTWNNTIQRFDLDGGSQSTFASTNLSSPFDVYFRENDVLVSNSSSDDIEWFDLAGGYLGKFVDSTGAGNVNFPEQIARRANGNVLVAGFSPAIGIYEYDSEGVLLNFYAFGNGNRGVYELGNGDIMFTDGNGVYRIDSVTGSLVTLKTGGSFRFIEWAPVPEPSALAGLSFAFLGVVTMLRRRR
ncbi:MAG: PEP-CTERM sorting domain-containing protein [Fimbriimonadia bacterium]|jgi:hypothetical protein